MNCNQVLNTKLNEVCKSAMPNYKSIRRDDVELISNTIRKLNLKGLKTYYEVIFHVESNLNIRITNIDTQTCRSNITRAVTKSVGRPIGGVKKGYNFV